MRRPAILVVTVALALGLASTSTADVGSGDKPSLHITTLDGSEVELSDWRGRVVLVDFWATWCAPCQVSLPFYQSLVDRYSKKNFRVLAVSVNKQKSKVTKFLEDHDFSFAVTVDSDHRIAEMFEPDSMPTLFVIGPDGSVRVVHEGFKSSDREELSEKIDELVAEAKEKRENSNREN